MQNKKTIRLLLTGGETGGHLYPALAVAEMLAKIVPGSESIYVGAAGRIDMKKSIGAEYTTHSLSMAPYDRKSLFGNLGLPWRLFKSFFQTLHILQQYRPHAVMGVGAFPSVPVIYAAWLKKIPTLLLEPNAQPGLANTILAKLAHRICVSKAGMDAFFPQDKIVNTGTPMRSSLLQEASDRKGSCSLFGIPPDTRTVLITGGSTGSITINNMVLENLDRLAGSIGHLLWQTGERDEKRIRAATGTHLPENCTILPYIDRMGCAYAVADLVISSAGAVSLSELALLGKPAVIIPDPDVTENHQLKNAQDLHDKNACILLDPGIPSRQAAARIMELINSPLTLEQLKNNILQHAEPQSARLIVEQILQLVIQRTSDR
ncbi:MAG: UDP-N-acetylglucosamine--N-acetylmuramyl-(pentapeptide) pyrophosphoryl-undecaprenol N-acetylglucosamine transferase [Proteobacteria bacterium]|nr:UDP-N-acetylglucosamine--N-acetylmuramyl-(pentapeptide) pyrophosphoryl-undecaprenol N-acetylglucosamine transferase [Pseudomonadota bacterium]MBU1388834.1 UDP-N-acetylglucosamine--N-acetylmuramyl-(pentapeptide) pyrophosphoryl-undecaprenol N-acetylglucosamine transferase [Pseudomonadota bacterium]MBU1542215.1 UDP-N-acetylglucosamine--N-acetylmuramyl-(pentapeptide) pyrophosphoryl-undecaprenol N-acetylglucosamine transferase [Pseudomonadota bacterium]MBU2429919.1 UDP-N-acetylglucosamine--N-acety